MKEHNSLKIPFTQALLGSMAITAPIINDTSSFPITLAINFVLFLLVSIQSWKEINNNFSQIYQKQTHFNTLEDRQKFAGIQLTTRDSTRLREIFVSNKISDKSKIKSYLINIALYAFYVGAVFILIPSEQMRFSLIGLSAFMFSFLFKARFWGSYLLYSFVSLILFSFLIDLNSSFSYLVLLVYISIFLYLIQQLNSWYWKALSKEHYRSNFKENIKDLITPIFIFVSVFIFVDFNIAKNKSFASLILNKLLESKVQNRLQDLDIDRYKNLQHNPKTQKLTNELTKLISKAELSKEDMERLVDIVDTLDAHEAKLIKKEVDNLLNQKKANISKNNEQANQIIRRLKLESQQELTTSQQQLLKQIEDMKNIETSGFDSQNTTIDKASKAAKKLSLAKQLEQISNDPSKLEDQLGALNQEEIIKRIKEDLQKVKGKENKSQLLQKKLRDEIYQQQLNDNPNTSILEQELSKQEINTLTDITTKPKIIKEVIKTEQKHLINEEKKIDKKKRFIAYIVFFLVLLNLGKIFRSLFSNKEYVIKHEELNQKQKDNILDLLKSKKEYSNFHEELDFKFKQFYEFLVILFYSPDFAPPPGLIYNQIENIPSKELRTIGKIMGETFNSFHYAGTTEFSKKEISTFRKAYKIYIKHAKGLV